jgi:hypothetical protein
LATALGRASPLGMGEAAAPPSGRGAAGVARPSTGVAVARAAVAFARGVALARSTGVALARSTGVAVARGGTEGFVACGSVLGRGVVGVLVALLVGSALGSGSSLSRASASGRGARDGGRPSGWVG